EHSPGTWDSLEFMFFAIGEGDAGTGNQINDGAGREYFAGLCERGDSCADVNSDPADVIVHDLDFACVQSGSHCHTEFYSSCGDRGGASNRSCGTVEGG